MRSSISMTSAATNASITDNMNHDIASRSSSLSKTSTYKTEQSLGATKTSSINHPKLTRYSNDIREAKDNATNTNLQSSPFTTKKQISRPALKELKRENNTMLSAEYPVFAMRSRSLSAPNLCPLTVSPSYPYTHSILILCYIGSLTMSQWSTFSPMLIREIFE